MCECMMLTAAFVTTNTDSFDKNALGSPQLFIIVRTLFIGNNRSSGFSTIFGCFFEIISAVQLRYETITHDLRISQQKNYGRFVICLLRLCHRICALFCFNSIWHFGLWFRSDTSAKSTELQPFEFIFLSVHSQFMRSNTLLPRVKE